MPATWFAKELLANSIYGQVVIVSYGRSRFLTITLAQLQPHDRVGGTVEQFDPQDYRMVARLATTKAQVMNLSLQVIYETELERFKICRCRR